MSYITNDQSTIEEAQMRRPAFEAFSSITRAKGRTKKVRARCIRCSAEKIASVERPFEIEDRDPEFDPVGVGKM
jgi:hypothetical protein